MGAVASLRAGLRVVDRRLGVVLTCSFLFIAARMSLMTFLAIFLVRERGIDETIVGLGFLAENLTRGLVAPPLGALSDRIGRRPILVASALLTAAVLPLFLLVHTPTHLLGWSIVLGLVGGGWFPALLALLLDLAPRERRQSVLAINYTALSLGYTLGVAPAGYIAKASYTYLAVGSGVLCVLIGVVLLLGLRGALPREPAAQGPLARRLSISFRDREFVLFIAIALVFPLALGLITTALPLYAAAGAVDEGTIGIALSLNGVVLAALSIPVGMWLERHSPFRWLALAPPILAASFLVLVLPAGFGVLVASTFVFTMGELVFSSTLPTAVASLARPGLRGAYQGTWSLVFAVAVGLSLFVMGALKDALGWSRAWVVVAAFFLLSGGALAVLRGRFERVAAERAKADAPAPA